VGEAFSTHVGRKIFLSENFKKADHLGDLTAGRRIIL
jgi:hypothetical protein